MSSFQCWLKRTATTKKGHQLFGERKVPTENGEKSARLEKILATHMRKGPPPYVGMGLPEWLIRPCSQYIMTDQH